MARLFQCSVCNEEIGATDEKAAYQVWDEWRCPHHRFSTGILDTNVPTSCPECGGVFRGGLGVRMHERKVHNKAEVV